MNRADEGEVRTMVDPRDARVVGDRETGPKVRRLVLALVLGLLGVLILFVTAQAYVAQKTEDSLVDFDSGTFLFTGLLDIPPDTHSVQLLPIGLTGEWGLSANRLPEPLTNLTAIANGDMLYVIGGTSTTHTARQGVYLSQMSLEGELIPWQTKTALPEGRAGMRAAVYPLNTDSSMLYVVGGFGPDFNARNTVYRATLDNNTGQVGAWAFDGPQVPHALYYAPVVEHEGRLYVIGGYGGPSNPVAFTNTYYAPINANGSLNPFVETAPLPEPLYSGHAVVYDGLDGTDTLYYIGGRNTITSTFKVYFADFLPGGGLSAWQLSKGNLPIHLYAHSGVLVNQGEIIVTGGIADDLDPSTGISSTVKAALVDPKNPSFRLYDWCLGVPPPACTIGAWQTGALLPEVRAFHGTEAGHGYVYVLGGADEDQDPSNTVFFGSVNGIGALYSPDGLYRSDELDLEQPASLLRLTWNTTIGHPGEMGLRLQYQTSPDGETWSGWSDWVASQDGLNQIEPLPSPTGIRYIQYQAQFTTVVSNASPLLDRVDIYYEVDDPDVAVRKDTGSVISVELGSNLQYTVYYTNSGGWVAEDVVLTETLPDNTTYAGGTDWHQVGDSNQYTYQVGDVESGASGSANFQVRINDQMPPGVLTITNLVEIDYPPMIDAFQATIVDPNRDDNWFEFGNPLALYAMTVTKDAEPPPGSFVTPGSYINYTIRYTNTGTRLAPQVVLTDTFDPLGGYRIVSISPPPDEGNNVWHLGDLASRQTGEIQALVQVNEPWPSHWLVTNQAGLYGAVGEPYHTPVITHTVMNLEGGEPIPMIDLTVSDLYRVPSFPQAGTWPKFYATVQNIGDADAGEPFWLALYVKPHPSEPPQWPADHDRGYCLNDCTVVRPHYVGYVHDGLAAGGQALVPFENLNLDPSPDFPARGAYDIYVQVDVAFGDDNGFWGQYAEDYEDNNIWQGTLLMGPSPVFLPQVCSNWVEPPPLPLPIISSNWEVP